MADSADLDMLISMNELRIKELLTKFPPTRNHRRPSRSVFGPLGQLVTDNNISRGRDIQDEECAGDRNGPRLYPSLSAG